jgi:hypothetical protein
MTMTKRPALGNLDIRTGEKTVELHLLTYRKGRPVAVFTYAEIKHLSNLLGSLSAPEVEDDDDGMDLI